MVRSRVEGGGNKGRGNINLHGRDKVKILNKALKEHLTQKVISEGNEGHHTVLLLYHY